jgi:hypothetical protein
VYISVPEQYSLRWELLRYACISLPGEYYPRAGIFTLCVNFLTWSVISYVENFYAMHKFLYLVSNSLEWEFLRYACISLPDQYCLMVGIFTLRMQFPTL